MVDSDVAMAVAAPILPESNSLVQEIITRLESGITTLQDQIRMLELEIIFLRIERDISRDTVAEFGKK